MTATLTAEEAKRFYDRLGRWQDSQRFYEDPAIEALIAHADFEHAVALFEFGCGTGRLAERLLRRHLPGQSRYLGVDVSSTMTNLALDRIRPWKSRAEVRPTQGSLHLEAPTGSFDRFLATYVLDLLSEEDIRTLIAEAHRVLTRGGLLCLVSLTEGVTRAGRLASWLLQQAYSRSPGLFGGCRPIHLDRLVRAAEWTVRYRAVVTAWGITSEILVAQK